MSRFIKVLRFLKIMESRLVTRDYEQFPFYQRRFNKYNPLSYIAIPMLYLISWEMPNWNMVKSGYFFKWK